MTEVTDWRLQNDASIRRVSNAVDVNGNEREHARALDRFRTYAAGCQ